jgi:hypothetical protein
VIIDHEDAKLWRRSHSINFFFFTRLAKYRQRGATEASGSDKFV